MNGEDKKDRIVIIGDTKQGSGPPRVGLRTGDYKYITTTGPDKGYLPLSPPPERHQLYDLRKDPGEHHNIAYDRPNILKQMQHLLSISLDGNSRQIKPRISKKDAPKAFDRLKSLGYVQ